MSDYKETDPASMSKRDSLRKLKQKRSVCNNLHQEKLYDQSLMKIDEKLRFEVSFLRLGKTYVVTC